LPEESPLQSLISKPNRAAIINLLGENGELGFTELRTKLGVGVGTLYYHLDGLPKYVTQRDSKKYTLTDAGKEIYFEMNKGGYQPVKVEPKKGISSVSDFLRDLFLLEAQAGRLGTDRLADATIAILLVFMGAVLAGTVRVDTAMFFAVTSYVGATAAFTDFVLSWSVVFVVSTVVLILVYRSREIASVAAATSFSFLPSIFFMLVTSLRRNFGVTVLSPLYDFPVILIFQIGLMVWAGYLLTVSLRSGANLTLEKTVLVTLSVVVINLGFLWARPDLLRVL
jgi:hypothetical protein